MENNNNKNGSPGFVPPQDLDQAKSEGFGYCSTQDISNNYVKVKQLGKGAYGSVWLVTHKRHPGFSFALKEIRFANPDTARKALEEAQLLHKFSGSEYILRYVACAFEGYGAIIVTELCEGSLHDVLVKHARSRQYLEEDTIIKWTYQMAKALELMHQHNIIHRDIKPGNVLVKDGNVKLADLGIATYAQVVHQQPFVPYQPQLNQAVDHKLTQAMGTADYMPFEQFTSSSYDVSVDVFSLGVVLYELITLRNASMDAFHQARSFTHGQPIPHPFVYGGLSLANSVNKSKGLGFLRMLLRNVLCPRPQDRMRASVLVWMLDRFYKLHNEQCYSDFVGDLSAPEAEYMLLHNQTPRPYLLRTSSERFCLGLSVKEPNNTVSHFRIELCDSGSYRLRRHPDGRPGTEIEDFSLDQLLETCLPLCVKPLNQNNNLAPADNHQAPYSPHPNRQHPQADYRQTYMPNQQDALSHSGPVMPSAPAYDHHQGPPYPVISTPNSNPK